EAGIAAKIGQREIVVHALAGVCITPRVLAHTGGVRVHLPMHLHDRRKAAELGPAHEKIRSRYGEVGVLVSADIVAPNRVTAHRRRKPGDDHAWQTVCLPEVRLVVPGPAAGKGLRAGEAAARKKEPALLQYIPDGPVILQSVTIAHFPAGATVG